MGTRYVAIGKTSSGKTVWGKPTPTGKSSSSGGGSGGGGSSKKTYTYKLGDKPPKESDYSSHAEYSRASYAYSKNKRAVTIARVKAGQSVSSSELRGAGIQKLPDRAIRTVSGGKSVMAVGGYKYYDSATKKYVTIPPTAQFLAEQKAKEQKETEALKAATTKKEKDVMKLQYAIQQGMLSPGALKKAKAGQQEIIQTLPGKEPVKTAFELGGQTFTGTYGLSRTAPKQKEAVSLPLAQFSTKGKENLNILAPERKPGPQESILPFYAGQPIYGIRPESMNVEENISDNKLLAPVAMPGPQESAVPSNVTGYKFDVRNLKPFDVEKHKILDLTMDMSKVAGYRDTKVGWENVKEIESALGKSNLLVQKSLLRGQTLSKEQASDIRIGEEVSTKVKDFYGVQSAKPIITIAGTALGVGAAGQILGAASKVAVAGKLIKIGSPVLMAAWGTSLASSGVQSAKYMREGQTERGLLGFANIGAQLGGVALAGKWLAATQGKPITSLYKQTIGKAYNKIRGPFFDKSITKWEKGLTDKNFIYSDKAPKYSKYEKFFTPEEYAGHLIKEGKLKSVTYYYGKQWEKAGLSPKDSGEIVLARRGIKIKPEIRVRVEPLSKFIRGMKQGIPEKVLLKYTPKTILRHELLHYKYPSWKEADILRMQDTILKFPKPAKTTYSLEIGTPQRTLGGIEITKPKIKWLREDVNKGFFNIDPVRTQTKGWDFDFAQQHLTSDYKIKHKLSVFKKGRKTVVKRIPYVKEIIPRTDPTRAINVEAIDWLQGKKIVITPKKMDTWGYSQMLDVEPTRFTFIKKYPITPTLGEKMSATHVPNWPDVNVQSQLIKRTTGPFVYRSKPKIPGIKTKEPSIILTKSTPTKEGLFLSYKTDRTALDRAAKTSKEVFMSSNAPGVETVFVQDKPAATISDFKGKIVPVWSPGTEEKIKVKSEEKLLQLDIPTVKQESPAKVKPIAILDISQIQKQVQAQEQKPIQIVAPITITSAGSALRVEQVTKQEPIIDQVIDPVVTPIIDIPTGGPPPPIIEEPPPRIIHPGLPSFSLKKRAMPGIDFGFPELAPRKRGVDIAPLSDLLSINITEMFTGGRRATHPRITEEEKLLFDTGIKRGRQYFPTMEMRAGKVKTPRSFSIFGTTKRKHKKSRKKGDWVFDLL